MITTKKYDVATDYNRVIEFLQEQYKVNRNQDCWLAQRWEDMEYRIDALHTKERNAPSWHDYIMLWQDDGKIVAVCNNEGGRECWMNIAKGYEYLFDAMLDWAEQIISNNPYKWEGKLTLSVFALSSCEYKQQELLRRGYIKNTEEFSYFKVAKCDKQHSINIPNGFKIIEGTIGMNHAVISHACECGFHPEKELEKPSTTIKPSWESREHAPMFDYTFEVVAQADNGDIASYSYCWVDKVTNTGYIEPVSTREKYRKLGLGKCIQLATLNILNRHGVDVCYVNPYGEGRDKFYSSAGYQTYDQEYEWKKEF